MLSNERLHKEQCNLFEPPDSTHDVFQTNNDSTCIYDSQFFSSSHGAALAILQCSSAAGSSCKKQSAAGQLGHSEHRLRAYQ